MGKQVLAKLGRNIHNLRKQKGFTQESLAEVLGMHQTTVGKLEIGKINASVLTLEKIAKTLKVKLEDLFKF